MRTISAIFQGEVITVGAGKLSFIQVSNNIIPRIHFWFIIPKQCWLGVIRLFL